MEGTFLDFPCRTGPGDPFAVYERANVVGITSIFDTPLHPRLLREGDIVSIECLFTRDSECSMTSAKYAVCRVSRIVKAADIATDAEADGGSKHV